MSNQKQHDTDKDDIKKQVKARASEEKAATSYFVDSGFWCRWYYPKVGNPSPVKLCNFTAKIVQEDIIDDGRDSQHYFLIEGKLHDRVPLQKIEIPAEKFPGLTWVSRWGSRCCLEPGQTVKDFVRHAIQKASPDAPVFTHYGHLGWREINGQFVYLHAGGAIGCADGVSVRVTKELERYILPRSPNGDTARESEALDAEKKGLETSLSFLNIGSRAVTLPLWCLTYLAPLTTILNPMPNFSGYLFGSSGNFKTTAALLALGHFGSFSGAESLSNFEDTPGILEKRSFTLKDSLHVIDDYHPSANRKAAESKESIAQRMIRAYSNRTARGRLNSDMSERGRYEPRGVMVITAEEQPLLESTLARVCIIEVTEGALDRAKLSAIQKNADALPFAMSSYLAWIKDNMAEIKETFPARFRALREQAAAEGFHKKLPEQAAFLGFALETATSFFNEKGALSDEAAAALVSEGWGIFRELAAKQQQRIEEDDPVLLFFDQLSIMLIQGMARLECAPWYSGERIGSSEQHIGWYDANHVYLMPTAVWHIVQRRCISENTHFPFTKNTFFKMLKNRGIIIPSSKGDSSNVITIKGKSVRVLKIVERGIYDKCVISVNG